jgi:hypothetical protein
VVKRKVNSAAADTLGHSLQNKSSVTGLYADIKSYMWMVIGREIRKKVVAFLIGSK